MKKLITAVTLATVCFFSMNAGASLDKTCQNAGQCRCVGNQTASCTGNKCSCTPN